ncbi:MAG: glycoside hydrolase family 3 N-terminal domain-containing protein [Bacteroidota bacterium]|nr:glycoside hydrolase family 3 N-terminal domain-containing protein [Bacteroidota bacterium]
MTLEEKTGQLSQPVLQQQDETLYKKIQKGEIVSFCVVNTSIFTPTERNKLQKQAIEGSRLGIPLLFAFDVIYGFSTIFSNTTWYFCILGFRIDQKLLQ